MCAVECKLSGILIKYILVYHIKHVVSTYIQTAHIDSTCFIWYTKIYLISIHHNLHLNSTQRHNMLYMVY
jgi:hypothetical protein